MPAEDVPNHVSILGMLEGVLKAKKTQDSQKVSGVSILGMLEGVLKDSHNIFRHIVGMRFNPWYVGGGVKREKRLAYEPVNLCFNPWYVGGGVKSLTNSYCLLATICVSILGMLEGVLKGGRHLTRRYRHRVSILGMLEGVLKAPTGCGLMAKKDGVSILGMLEGVLKENKRRISLIGGTSFNPWYVGGGVKSRAICWR